MANEAEELLAAEEAVQELLKELEGLKKQMGGYDQARQSLEGTRLTLQTMVERTQSLSEKAHLAITALNKISTPEILSRVDGVQTAIKKLNRATMVGAVFAGLALLVTVLILAKMIVG